MSRFSRAFPLFAGGSRRRQRKQRRLRTSFIEQLEDRRLLAGTVTITGTSGNDTLRLRRIGTNQAQFEYSLDNITYTPLGYRTQLSFDGQGGTDTLLVNATDSYLSNRFTITETGIDGLTGFSGHDIIYANVESLDFQGDYGHNDITIDMDNQVTSLVTATINGNAGNDRIHLAGVANLSHLYLQGGTGNDTFGSVQGRIVPSTSTTIVLSGETSTAFSATLDGSNNIAAASGDAIELDLGAWSTQPELVNTRSGQLFSGVTATQPGAIHRPLYFNGMEQAKLWSDNQLTSTTAGDLFIRGSESDDTINVNTSSTAFTVNIGEYTSSSYALNSGKRVLIQSGSGNDSIYTFNSIFPNSMEVDGGTGNDTIIMNNANTGLVVGGLGNDTIRTYGNASVIWGDDVATGYDRQGKPEDGDDTINCYNTSDNTVFGGGGNDLIYGQGGNDYLSGGLGDDKIAAGPGDDLVRGGPGNDSLYTSATTFGVGSTADGRDILLGGPGQDFIPVGWMYGRTIVIGGEGGDNFTNNSQPGVTGDKLVVAGHTSFDRDNGVGSAPGSNDSALMAIRNEWSSTTTSVANRIAHLSNTLGGGLNAGNFLNASTVFEDNAGESSSTIKISYDQGTTVANHWLIKDSTASSIVFTKYYSSHPLPVTSTSTYTTAIPASSTIPLAAPDTYITSEDTPLEVLAAGVLQNDTSPLGYSLTAVSPSVPTQGALSLDATGRFTFTPPAHYSGTASFTYRASDGSSNSSPTTVTITVNAVNDAPVLADASPEDTIYYHSNQTPVTILPSIIVQDADTGSTWNGGSLVVAKNGDLLGPNDIIDILHQGTAAGQIGVSGNNITYGGVVIGNFAGGIGTAPLAISFSSPSATTSAIQALARAIRFRNTNPNDPDQIDRPVTLTFNDGAGGVSTIQKRIYFGISNVPPTLFLGTNVTFTEGEQPRRIFPNAVVDDPDTEFFVGGSLQIERNTNLDPSDLFGINHAGLGQGQIGISGNTILYENVVIGTFATGAALTVSFQSTATPVSIQALVRSITYVNANDINPVVGSRSIIGRLTDGEGGERVNNGTVTVEVLGVNDPAELILNASAPTYVENAPATRFITSLSQSTSGPVINTFRDLDSSNYDTGSLTVAISNNMTPSERLSIGNYQAITTTGNSVYINGVNVGTWSGGTNQLPLQVVLNASATANVVGQVLEAVDYRDTTDNPLELTRQITIQLNDGDGGDNNGQSTASLVLTVEPVNDSPLLSTSSAAVFYYEDGPPVVILEDATVFDPDSAQFIGGSLKVYHIGFFDGYDVIELANSTGAANGISAIEENGTVYVLHSGEKIGQFVNTSPYDLELHFFTSLQSAGHKFVTASIAQSLLRSFTFHSLNTFHPPDQDRIVKFELSDGEGNGIATKTIKIVTQNDPPVILNAPETLQNTEGEESIIYPNAVRVEDNDTGDFNGGGLIIELTDFWEPEDHIYLAESSLGLQVVGNDVQWQGATVGTLHVHADLPRITISFTNSITAQIIEEILYTVRFKHLGPTPSPNPRTIRTVIDDGATGIGEHTTSVDVQAINHAPVILDAGSHVVFHEDGEAVSVFSTHIQVNDLDSPFLSGGVVSVTLAEFQSDSDILYIANQGMLQGQVGVIADKVYFGGLLIGEQQATLLNTLEVTLNGNATPEAVASVLRAMRYSSISNAPVESMRELTLIISDGIAASSPIEVSLQNIAINDIPIATNNDIFGVRNSNIVIAFDDLLVDDYDRDGTIVDVIDVGVPSHGSAQFDRESRRVIYTPTSDWVGQDSFQYLVEDDDGGVGIAMINVEVVLPPQISIQNAIGIEGGNLEFVVTRAGTSSLTSTVNYGIELVAGGAEPADVDLSATSGTLTFLPNEVSKSITVPTLQDTMSESTERFSIILSSPINATLSSDSFEGIGEIEDDDILPFTADVAVSGFSLVSDTGVSDDDLYTFDGRLRASVSGSYVGPVTVEFDHDGDGLVDGEANLILDRAVQEFLYNPVSHDSSLASGIHTIDLRYRLSVWSGNIKTVGEWTSAIEFTLQNEFIPSIAVYDGQLAPIPNQAGILDFGIFPLGDRVSRTVMIRNYGSEELRIVPNSFQLTSGYRLIALPAESVPANGGSTTFTVELHGTAVQPYMGEMSFTTNDPEHRNYSVSLSAVVRPSDARIGISDENETSLEDGNAVLQFGATNVATVKQRTLSIKNTGSEELYLEWGELPLGYRALQTDTIRVGPAGTAVLVIELMADAIGTFGGPAILRTNDPQHVQFDLHLSGTVSRNQPLVEVRLGTESGRILPSGGDLVHFGTVEIGSAATRALTISNRGNVPLDLHETSFEGPAGISISPLVTTRLESGASTQLTLLFQPTSEGETWGELILPTNDPDNNPFRVVVFGSTPSANSSSPQLASLSLLHDTGHESNDQVTSDPRVQGTVTGMELGEFARIEWDHDGNDAVNGITYISKSATDPAFIYDPRRSDAGYVASGAKRLRWRLVHEETVNNEQVEITTPWQSFVYTIEPLPVSVQIALVHDDGPHSNDRVTTNPTLSLQVAGPFGTSGIPDTSLRIEFDHTGNHQTQGSTLLSKPTVAGSYETYDPINADSTFASRFGYRTLYYRAVLLNADSKVIATGSWSTFGFTYLAAPTPTSLNVTEIDLAKGDWRNFR